MTSDVTGRSVTLMRMKTCMKSRPNLKLHSFQTVVVVVSSSRLVLPGALGLGPVLCPVLWGIGRRATATPANLSICADRDSRTLQVGNVWQVATSFSLLSRSGQARPSLATPHSLELAATSGCRVGANLAVHL